MTGSSAIPWRQGEVSHRYVLGLYRVMDGIIKTHPDIMFEGCAGGGGRFDTAMLTYFVQYWSSGQHQAPGQPQAPLRVFLPLPRVHHGRARLRSQPHGALRDQGGIPIPREIPEFTAFIYHLTAID